MEKRIEKNKKKDEEKHNKLGKSHGWKKEKKGGGGC